jgi:dephospho-CoA kinase
VRRIEVKILAIVGMPGSGKSALSDYLKTKGFPVIRFGEIIIREVERRGLPVTPRNEQVVREDLRKQHGMDVCARIASPFIKKNLADNQLAVIDGLYSFSEYKTLRNEFGNDLVVIAVFTPKKLRYQRLTSRVERPLTWAEAEERDHKEIERIEKAGPIALADFTLINDETQEQLIQRMDTLLCSLLEEGDYDRASPSA